MVIDELGANGNLHAFHRVHHQEPQVAIKRIPSPNYRECGPGNEGVVRLSEGIPVAAQSVVADGLELLDDLLLSRNQPSADKEICLLREGEGGFGVFHAAPRRAGGKMKNPPELSMTRKSGQRLGGSAGWNIAIPVESVK